MRTQGHGPTPEQHRQGSGEPQALRRGKSPKAKPKEDRHEVPRATEPADRIAQTNCQRTAGSATGSRARTARRASRGTRRQSRAGRPYTSTERPEHRAPSRSQRHREKHATAIDTRSNHSSTTPRRQGQAPPKDLQRTADNVLDRPDGQRDRSRTTASQRPAPTPRQTTSTDTRTESRRAPERYPRHQPRGRQAPSPEHTERVVKKRLAQSEAQSPEPRLEDTADTGSGTASRTEEAPARSARRAVKNHTR